MVGAGAAPTSTGAAAAVGATGTAVGAAGTAPGVGTEHRHSVVGATDYAAADTTDTGQAWFGI